MVDLFATLLQFFITATSDEQKPVENKIGRAIVERIVRAHNAGDDFRAQWANMSGLATKQQSHKIFEKLKAKPANKVSE